MSSPLWMPRKTRRGPPLGPADERRGRREVPFRRDLLKEFQAALTEGDNDDSSDPNAPQHSHTSASDTYASKSEAPLKKGAPPSDFELMSAMIHRVTLLEKKVTSQEQEIECKSKKISVLEEKLRVQKESETANDTRGRDNLERRCQQLQNQVYEMESFLNDYGLIWVGEGETGYPADCEQTHSSGASVVRDFHMDFDVVLRRIKELNALAGEGESYVQSTAMGAQLARKDPIQLRLYSNGIIMFDGPFRSYQEHSTQQCIQDLMDGYFPSELQERFPDGVPFEVHDGRDEEFIFRQNKFPGEGQAVCGEKDELSNTANAQIPGKVLIADQFLDRLPKVVVKAGQVINIRESLRATLRGPSDAQSSDSVILIDTAMKEKQRTFSSDRPPSAYDVITLKVKSEDGNRTYILKMGFSETIGHLRQYLDKHRGSGLLGYDIISTLPQCCYDDDCRTLQSCGLTTNATLLLRKRQHSLTGVNQITL